jgi:hypothetical protein
MWWRPIRGLVPHRLAAILATYARYRHARTVTEGSAYRPKMVFLLPANGDRLRPAQDDR